MFIERIRIANFKSFKDVEVRPSGLTTLVGPNNAGKTNFALAMEFLAEIPRHGLENAVARAGGLDGIIRRKSARPRAPIRFEIDVALVPGSEGPPELLEVIGRGDAKVRVSYSFSMAPRASARGPHGEFSVAREELRACVQGEWDRQRRREVVLYEVSRDGKGALHVEMPEKSAYARRLRSWLNSFPALERRARQGDGLPRMRQQAVLLESPFGSDPVLYALGLAVRGISVVRFWPETARRPSPPQTAPGPPGEWGGLASAVQWLKHNAREQWRDVLGGMQDVVPGVVDILVKAQANGLLELYLKEEGFASPWRAGEVSDGTLHVLSVLVAAADPRVSALVIEEPENSLHPWMIQEMGRRLRRLAAEKTVLLTTQSPVVIDMLCPGEVWVVSRKAGQTSIRRLTDLHPPIKREWEEGVAELSQYLDSGMEPRAVPGGADG